MHRQESSDEEIISGIRKTNPYENLVSSAFDHDVKLIDSPTVFAAQAAADKVNGKESSDIDSAADNMLQKLKQSEEQDRRVAEPPKMTFNFKRRNTVERKLNYDNVNDGFEVINFDEID